LSAVIGFLLILGPLVIIHELGHFIFAKLFNVKAEVFSVGFGPRIFSYQHGETEWKLSAIPLGGYVKLLGEDPNTELPPEDKNRSLQHQDPWKRFLIFFGGPLFNFLGAIAIYALMVMIGEPQLASIASRVLPNTPAYESGLRSGDKIIEINNKPVTKYHDLLLGLNELPNQVVPFKIERSSAPLSLQVKVGSEKGYSIYGENKDVGNLEGLLPMARGRAIGVSAPNSKAGLAGLFTKDEIHEFAGQKVSSFEEIEDLYRAQSEGKPISFKIVGKEKKEAEFSLFKPSPSLGIEKDWGLFSAELFIETVMPDSPASKMGLKSGDQILKVGDVEVYSFQQLREEIQKSGEKTNKIAMEWMRNGILMNATETPTATHEKDPNLNKTTQYTIGIMPVASFADPVEVIERSLNPFYALFVGAERTFVNTWRNFVALGKMITGDVSVKTLGGPILIAKISGESLDRGLIAILSTMAILSIGLGVLNILPVPVLDGGHIMLLLLEKIRGRPLNLNQLVAVQQVGLVFILLLMVVAFKNDISRLSFFQ
jgi:regulator of sigma E protease